MKREYIDLKQFIERDEGIVVEFYTIHYDALILQSVKPRELVWPKLESHNIFESESNEKYYPMCNKLTYFFSYFFVYIFFVHLYPLFIISDILIRSSSISSLCTGT